MSLKTIRNWCTEKFLSKRLFICIFAAQAFKKVSRCILVINSHMEGVLRYLLPPANEVWGKVIFLQQFVILFTRGGRAWLLWGGMRGCSGGACVVALGGHAWLLWGGMHGCSGGECVVALGGMCGCSQGGHVWLLQGGMCGCSGGYVVAWGACVVAPGGHAWLIRGVCGCLGGMHGCSRGGACMGYDNTWRYG